MKKISSPNLRRLFAYGPSLKPTRDWLIVLACILLVGLASIAWNTYFFLSLQKAPLQSAGQGGDKNTTQKAVTAVQSVFQKRALEEGKYQHDYTFVDPTRSGT